MPSSNSKFALTYWILRLKGLPGSSLNNNDLFPVVDSSASETKNIRADQFAVGISKLFPVGSIPGTAIDGELAPGSVNTIELADGSVTSVKLADNSSTLVGSRPASGDHVGQLCIDADVAYVRNGS